MVYNLYTRDVHAKTYIFLVKHVFIRVDLQEWLYMEL